MEPEKKKLIPRLLDGVQGVIEVICALSFIGLILPPFVQIITREVFGFSLVWSDELARYCGIWMIMLGASVLFRTYDHVNVDLILNRLSGNVRFALEIFIQAVNVSVMAYFTYYAVVLMKGTVTNRSPAMHVNMAYIYAGLVIGGVCCTVYAVEALVKVIRTRGKSAVKTIIEAEDEEVGGEGD